MRRALIRSTQSPCFDCQFVAADNNPKGAKMTARCRSDEIPAKHDEFAPLSYLTELSETSLACYGLSGRAPIENGRREMKAMGLEMCTGKYTSGAAGREARRPEAAFPVTRAAPRGCDGVGLAPRLRRR